MAVRFCAAVAAVALMGTLAHAEDRHQFVRKQTNGKMTITNVITLPCPVVEAKQDEKPPFKDAVPVTLEVDSWNGGRSFVDGLGRKWGLVDGVPVTEQYSRIPGWMVVTNDKREFFYSHGGRIFGKDMHPQYLSPFAMLAPLVSQPMAGTPTAPNGTNLYGPYLPHQRGGLYAPYLKNRR